MLAIDDIKKLGKMQEVLLKRTVENREENLEKYKNIVIQIDEYSFNDLFSELKQFNDRDQMLEEELQFLEQIKGSYQQLLEQQFGFKRVYELYCDEELKLSDLSLINIDYIENRINTISGYLINKKNIEINENKLEDLNIQLSNEEKNRCLLSNRLLDFEDSLCNNFISAEGRYIETGELQYISVVSEYDKLGYDFKELLGDTVKLEKLLSEVNNERFETEEKLKTAEICYNSVPSVESKQILDDINKEDIRIKYKLTMLKILYLLSKKNDDYELFKEKRERLIDLIKYRLNCLEKLGIRISIDPFSRTRVSEQLETLLSLKDNSRDIVRIKKEIAELDQRLEEMISNNKLYMIQLNDKKDLIISKTSINDIDISGVKLVEVNDDIISSEDDKIILDNQVVDIRDVSKQFNMGIVEQKTARVIRRVNEMVNSIEINEDKNEVFSPELVIVPSVVETLDISDLKDENIDNEIDRREEEQFESIISVPDFQDIDEHNGEVQNKIEFDSDIFTTVDPFVSTPLFTDRSDEDVKVSIFDELDNNSKKVDYELFFSQLDKQINDEVNKEEVVEKDTFEEEQMPDAFWVTHDEEAMDDNSDDVVPSFDEQIDALLSDERDVKTRKLVA